jgi:ATPase family AAA domain-containing protein 3A/B
MAAWVGKEIGTTVSAGVADFLQDRRQVSAVVVGATLLALGVYGARTGTGVVGRILEARIGTPPAPVQAGAPPFMHLMAACARRRLGKPSLVRDTSRRSPLWPLRHPVQAVRDVYRRWALKPAPLQDMVLDATLEQRLSSIAWTTINARKNRYGPASRGGDGICVGTRADAMW